MVKGGHSGEKDQCFLFYFLFFWHLAAAETNVLQDVWTELVTANDTDCYKITLCCAFKFNRGLLNSSTPVLVAGFKGKMLSQLPGASLE